MENKTFYNEILTEHNLHPYHKHKLEDANLVLEGVNPSCGDDIFRCNIRFFYTKIIFQCLIYLLTFRQT